ncbi:3-oxoacyl-ACP synthase III family protein [Mucilaginibacter xinganensis]|uniref:3-oxoacyl-acyl-carrier-protein synthase-3 n=1 Tax=Mucilaginibacter xinganensis TaxID=1234841 RepID=A0A223NV93_9SPHI|nr:ketoacyl-ACP synthase III [Mucilaginibacter xinganensis]ASU33594.1 3-oxoacyl-acyl-carrier-protein synthase-3 [Mucilaginibacter xinganensis]
MSSTRYSIIAGSGSYIPTKIIANSDFKDHLFYDQDGTRLQKSNDEIISKFEQITGIRERRYVTDDLVASDIGFLAARDAIEAANINPEKIDYIIVAHNFGDVNPVNFRSEFVPSLASRVKHHLGISNPDTVAYDLPFGCAGWLQGMIQADQYIKAGANCVLVIGAETLSRVCDPCDRDSMIYADGAGAVVLVATESEKPVGILSHTAKTYANELAFVLRMDKSYAPDYPGNRFFLKMNGRKLYEYALKLVPGVIKESIDKAGLSITDLQMLLIHQANHKMDEAIVKQLLELYSLKQVPDNFMPMTISWLGNSSVATLPTLYNLLGKGEIANHTLNKGSFIVFASVGAGVNINSMVYNIP